LPSRTIIPRIVIFKIKREIKTFQDKYKLKQFVNTRPALQKMLKGIQNTEEEKTYM
jgi:hypothetical protein